MFGFNTDGDGRSVRIVNAKGEVISENAFMSLETYVEQEEKGLTPMYFDVPSSPESHQRKREISTADERIATIKYNIERGFDARTHRWELHGTKSLALTKNMAGIVTDESFKTTMDGLYAIGDTAQAGGTILGSCNSGILAAEHIVPKLPKIKHSEIDAAQVKVWKDRLGSA